MSEQTLTTTIDNVTSKEGATNGRAWIKFTVKDGEGNFYSTFDKTVAEQAHALKGQRVELTWEPSGSEGQYRDIIGAKVATGFDPGAIPSARDEQGNADWDEIGLRKTRCLLWAHYLESPLAAQVATEAKEQPASDRVFNFGAAVIAMAEADIYRRPIADESETTPF